jgi:hypothetical protein
VIGSKVTRPGKRLSKARLIPIGYDLGSDSGKAPGNMLGYNSSSDSGKVPGNMLRYDSGKVPGSDSDKKSGTISGNNPDKRPGKKSGKELPDRVKTQVRRSGKTKMCKTRRPLCFG